MKIKVLPKVSVITSVLNDADNLIKAINSVRNQNYPNIEFLIIDGGSIDGTLRVIDENIDIIDYTISESDSGIYSAWNKGIRKSTGDWICFLGADDELTTNAISKMVECSLSQLVSVDYISGRTDLYINGQYYKTTGMPFIWKKFRYYLCTGHNAALHNRSLYEKYGLYDEKFRSAGDYEFLLRAGSDLNTCYIDYVTSKMNLGGVSNRSYKPLIEAYYAKRRNSTNHVIVEFILLFRGFSSYFIKKIVNGSFR